MVVNKINMSVDPNNVKRMFINRKMASDYTSDIANGNDFSAATNMMNFKNSSRSAVTTASHQQQQQQSSAVSSSRLAKTSLTSSSTLSSSQQRLAHSHQHHHHSSSSSQQQHHHISSSTSKSALSSSCSSNAVTAAAASALASDKKTSLVKNGLEDLKTSISEMKNISSAGGNLNLQKLRRSMENLVDEAPGDDQPLVTFPDDTPVHSVISSPTELKDRDTMKFEQKKMLNNFKSTMIKDGYTAEKQSSYNANMKSVQAGDLTYEENSASDARHARLEIDGVSAEKSLLKASEARSLIAGDISQQESSNIAQSSMKVTTDSFSTQNTATEAQKRSQTITSNSVYNENHRSNFNTTYTVSKGIHTSSSSILEKSNAAQFQQQSLTSGLTPYEEELLATKLDSLRDLTTLSTAEDVERAIAKYSQYIRTCITHIHHTPPPASAAKLLGKIYDVMEVAWSVQTHGHELGYSLCNTLRTCGGLDFLMGNCSLEEDGGTELKFASARLLEQCLTTENRAHVVQYGLDRVVYVACACTTNKENTVERSRIGTGILEHLFKHSEETCSAVVQLGGLDAILFECRKSDVLTLRHCATALANLSLYGGAENQEAMINRKVPMWLFPLAFHNDDNIKYYACLAITVLVANAEFESQVLQSGTLGLVEPFVTSHNPPEFAKSNLAHAHGQSKTWLQHLVPILNSKREEARNLAAFHFCMEAGIKKQQGNTDIFAEIGAVEILKKVASCPNAVASKYAAQALRLIGEKLPHKLSQQVPLWSVEDVVEWVKQIGFEESANQFQSSKVDGDLLLQLTEDNLRSDIALTNGIARTRFFRELQKLKRMADYSSRDTSNINTFLLSLGPEFSIYTYGMLNSGVDNDTLKQLSEDQLLNECGITNSIHRFRIMQGILNLENRSSLTEGNLDKSLDVFISYRRSNGSQLASLLKVHLELRGFSVFIDVERLEAGKFDNNLLQSIQRAKHFILVLTNQALDRCIDDVDRKDWVHREIVAALKAECNIIPITDNFSWPQVEQLPQDMQQVCHFNGVMWIHDYQDACVDKLERFLRGEMSSRPDGTSLSRVIPGTPSTAGIGSRTAPSYQRMHSNDSGKGGGSSTSSTTDKDVNGNSGGVIATGGSTRSGTTSD